MGLPLTLDHTLFILSDGHGTAPRVLIGVASCCFPTWHAKSICTVLFLCYLLIEFTAWYFAHCNGMLPLLSARNLIDLPLG